MKTKQTIEKIVGSNELNGFEMKNIKGGEAPKIRCSYGNLIDDNLYCVTGQLK